MRQKITVRLKPYLQEFLICSLASDHLEVSYNNIIGTLIGPYIEYVPADYKPERIPAEEKDQFIDLYLKDGINNKRYRHAIYVSKKNQRNFQRSLKTYFDEIFFLYIQDKIRYTSEIKKCILQFCSDYNITFNNLNYEMLKKKYYRRIILNKQKKVHKMSLTSPLIFLI